MVIALGSTAFASTTSTGFVFGGTKDRLTPLKSSIITKFEGCYG